MKRIIIAIALALVLLAISIPVNANPYGRCEVNIQINEKINPPTQYADDGVTLTSDLVGYGTDWGTGMQYKLVVPAGTQITNPYGFASTTLWVVNIYKGYMFFFEPMDGLKLSQAATLYRLTDGEWLPCLSFTDISKQVANNTFILN